MNPSAFLPNKHVVQATIVDASPDASCVLFDNVVLQYLNMGKTVVVDFWHYKCIHCIQTLPHLLASTRMLDDVVLITCALGCSDFPVEELNQYKSLIEGLLDNDVGTTAHLIVDKHNKEKLKARYKFNSVPHCISIRGTIDNVCKHNSTTLASDLQQGLFTHTDDNTCQKKLRNELLVLSEDF